MTVYWKDTAIEDVREIGEYIGQTLRNPGAADRIANMLLDAAEPLTDNPRSWARRWARNSA